MALDTGDVEYVEYTCAGYGIEKTKIFWENEQNACIPKKTCSLTDNSTHGWSGLPDYLDATVYNNLVVGELFNVTCQEGSSLQSTPENNGKCKCKEEDDSFTFDAGSLERNCAKCIPNACGLIGENVQGLEWSALASVFAIIGSNTHGEHYNTLVCPVNANKTDNPIIKFNSVCNAKCPDENQWMVVEQDHRNCSFVVDVETMLTTTTATIAGTIAKVLARMQVGLLMSGSCWCCCCCVCCFCCSCRS